MQNRYRYPHTTLWACMGAVALLTATESFAQATNNNASQDPGYANAQNTMNNNAGNNNAGGTAPGMATGTGMGNNPAMTVPEGTSSTNGIATSIGGVNGAGTSMGAGGGVSGAGGSMGAGGGVSAGGGAKR